MQGWLFILLLALLGFAFGVGSIVLAQFLGPGSPRPRRQRRTSAACRRSATPASGSR